MPALLCCDINDITANERIVICFVRSNQSDEAGKRLAIKHNSYLLPATRLTGMMTRGSIPVGSLLKYVPHHSLQDPQIPVCLFKNEVFTNPGAKAIVIIIGNHKGINSETGRVEDTTGFGILHSIHFKQRAG